MRTEIKVILLMMAVVTLALFWDDVLAAVQGMTPLEAAEFFWMVTVKATVLAICAWLASTVPHIVKPWIKMIKGRGRQWRSGPNAQWQKTPRMPRLTAEQKFWIMMARANGQTRRSVPTPESTQRHKLNIKW